MNYKTFDKLEAEVLKKAHTLMAGKKEVYAPVDALSNIRQVAGLRNTSLEDACFGMLVKHLAALSDFCKDPTKVSLAEFDEKIIDSINYLIHIYAIIHE